MRYSFGGHPVSGSTLSLKQNNKGSASSTQLPFAVRPLSLFSTVGPPSSSTTPSSTNNRKRGVASTRGSPRSSSRATTSGGVGSRGSIIHSSTTSTNATSNTSTNATTADRLTNPTDGSYLNAYLLDTPRASNAASGTSTHVPPLPLGGTTVLSPPEPTLGMTSIQPNGAATTSSSAVVVASTTSPATTTSTVRGHRTASSATSSAPPSPPFATGGDDKDSPLLTFEHPHATTALGAGVGAGTLARVPELDASALGLGEGKHHRSGSNGISSGAGSRAAVTTSSSSSTTSLGTGAGATSSSRAHINHHNNTDSKRTNSTSSGGDSPGSSSSSSARERKPRKRRYSFTATVYSPPNIRDGYFDPEENRRMVLQTNEDPTSEDRDGGQWVEFKRDSGDASVFKSKSFQELGDLAQVMRSHRGVGVKTRQWRNRTFDQCFIGSELVDWMVTYLRESWGIRDRRTAVALGQSLLECQFIQSMHHEPRFHDLHAFYQFTEPPITIVNMDEEKKKSSHSSSSSSSSAANSLMSPKARNSTLLNLLGSSTSSTSATPAAATSVTSQGSTSPSPPDSPSSAPAPPHPLDIIHQSLSLIIELFRITAGSEPREIPLRCRHEWHAFVRNVAKLRDAAHQVTLEQLDATELRCFFLNAYHTLFVHAIVKYGLPSGRDDWLRFCRQMHYCIGGMNFSLLDIEYAVLRAKLPMSHLKQRDQLVLFPPKFTASDPRYRYSSLESDPRLSFALCNGTLESPDIRVFTVETMDVQLTQASQLYIKDHVRFSYVVHHNYPFLEVLVPAQFYLYRWEIGKADNKILQWIADYHWDWVEQSKIMDFLHAKAFAVQFKPFDWSPSLACFLRSADRTQELERDEE